MENFVTLFNNAYLPQGVALHMSMERHFKSYTLWILCVDDETYEMLLRANLPNVRLLQLTVLESQELLKVKSERSIGEYCWTLTPFAPKFVFEASDDVMRVTYVDADLWFRKDPRAIFRELDASGKQVLITDHAYAAQYDQSVTSGQYCVQFMTFTRGGGEPVRKWWEERCIEWCFGRFEDGKFGDQKYLDDWPERFSEQVHVLNDKELALAPWNATRFGYGRAVFFHFHGVRIINKEQVFLGGYERPSVVMENIYNPYFRDLQDAISKLEKIGFVLKTQAVVKTGGRSLLSRLGKLYRRLHLVLQPDSVTLGARN